MQNEKWKWLRAESHRIGILYMWTHWGSLDKFKIWAISNMHFDIRSFLVR